ncbi:MAG: hypothetical protein PHW77_00430 [Eubacteriales bacterium]|nr:hypothetical protein [Eubacteriales bacterium]
MKIKKIISLVVVILMVTSFFCACDKTTETGNVSQTSQNTNSDEGSTLSGENTKEALVPHLEDADIDLNGFELKILTSVDERIYAIEQFVGYIDDDGKSDPVSVAVFERNARLEQEYGFTIKYEALDIGFGDFLTRVRNDMAGDTADFIR